MNTFTVTKEQILVLVEHLAILQDSDIKKKEIKNLMSFSQSILEILCLDEVVSEELEYLRESKN